MWYPKLDPKIKSRHSSLWYTTLGPGYKGEGLLTKQRLENSLDYSVTKPLKFALQFIKLKTEECI